MSENRRVTLMLLAALVLLPVALGLAGWHAGPSLARRHYLVKVAEKVTAEHALPHDEQSLETQSFYRLGGVPPEALFAEAEALRSRFARGTALLGVFIGVVAAGGILRARREALRSEYEADRGQCLACARCFLSCPVELERRGLMSPIGETGKIAPEAETGS